MTFIFFNLLANSILSLFMGLMVVYFSIWLFRIETSHWKLFLLSLPFLKIVYDFARGVPEKSILFSGVDPFSLPPKHQLLSIGAGFDGWTPYINSIFAVNGLDGKIYSSSLGDYLVIWMHRTFGSHVPLIVVSIVLSVSCILLFYRFIQYSQFERLRRLDRKTRPTYQVLHVDYRSVDIYISPSFSGTPFTGGIFKPYVCLPQDAIDKLSSEEITAVIGHEMGHVRYYDLALTVMVQVLGDLFWFIPGYRWLSRKIDRMREVMADRSAVKANVEPQYLASALLKLKEIPDNTRSFVLYSAFFREKSLLKERVERLLGNRKDKSPRFGWQYKWIRIAVTIFIAIVALNSVLGGNYSSDLQVLSPQWIKDLVRVSCLCVSHKIYVQA